MNKFDELKNAVTEFVEAYEYLQRLRNNFRYEDIARVDKAMAKMKRLLSEPLPEEET